MEERFESEGASGSTKAAALGFLAAGDPRPLDGGVATHLALNLRLYLDFPVDVCCDPGLAVDAGVGGAVWFVGILVLQRLLYARVLTADVSSERVLELQGEAGSKYQRRAGTRYDGDGGRSGFGMISTTSTIERHGAGGQKVEMKFEMVWTLAWVAPRQPRPLWRLIPPGGGCVQPHLNTDFEGLGRAQIASSPIRK